MKKRLIKQQRNIALGALAFYATGKTDGGHKAVSAVRRVDAVKQGKQTDQTDKPARRSKPLGRSN